MNPTIVELMGTVIFAIAVLHTFVVTKIDHWSHHHVKPNTIASRFLHYCAEVEAVFGMWALVFIVGMSFAQGFAIYDDQHQLIGGAIHYLESLNFTEPAFVFVIMCMAATRPVIKMAEGMIHFIAKALPLPKKQAFYITTLVIGPLLGSFITEPAAMTLTAMILLDAFYKGNMSSKFKYATIGLLFVNVSVGGTLSHFAAPPVLMVAGKYHWGLMHMITHFGYKFATSILLSTLLYAFAFRKELQGDLENDPSKSKNESIPFWISAMHIIFLALVVYMAHHMVFFLGLFLFFLGFVHMTKDYQDTPKLRESLLVGFFLAGLVTLGTVQSWWLQVVLTKLGDLTLYLGATALTAITDNAALTYLGSLVELTESQKFNLVAGAVTGGGLTVIANAPNPAGYGILKDSFGKEGVSPLWLFVGGVIPTVIAIFCAQLLPHLASAVH